MRWRWLLLLPLAVVLVLVATASRAYIFWWPDELHDETLGQRGEPVRVSDVWVDEDGAEQRRELTVTLAEVRPALTVETYSGTEVLHPPEGTAVWRIELDFEVDPEVPLGGCQVSLIDTEGREADAVGGSFGDVSLPFTSCEPEGRPGPQYDGSRTEGSKPRPESYRVAVYAVTAASAEPDRVRVWWEAPDYVEISVTEP